MYKNILNGLSIYYYEGRNVRCWKCGQHSKKAINIYGYNNSQYVCLKCWKQSVGKDLLNYEKCMVVEAL